jgi:ABC-type multidrug transport system fused ATPase/permease subunit
VFEDVGYAYRAGRPVLSDVTFAVDGVQAVGVIGPSGAGKSTLVQLLLGLRAPGQGKYLVNGTPAHEFLPADWHRLVAYLPQEPHLLHASVADNIRYFRELDDEAVQRAARLARIHDDVMGWADGYETIVGPRADAVSGGQQQRICLARALAARPQMLVLDEPTSALDPTSEMLIGQSLTELEHELILFIVAHRMSTLDICDRVMIILDGKLAAFDTVTNLQQHNPYYRTAAKVATGGMLTTESTSAGRSAPATDGRPATGGAPA